MPRKKAVLLEAEPLAEATQARNVARRAPRGFETDDRALRAVAPVAMPRTPAVHDLGPHDEDEEEEGLDEGGPEAAKPAIAIRGAFGDVPPPDQPTKIAPDALDPLTGAIGARVWRNAAVFDWCVEQNERVSRDAEDRRPRYAFTRHYFEQRVLVDIFTRETPAVRREVAQKTAQIKAYNDANPVARPGRPPAQGYIPIIWGTVVTHEQIAAAKEGHLLPLLSQRTIPGAFV